MRLFAPVPYIPKGMSIVLKDSSSTKLCILRTRLSEMGLQESGGMLGIEWWTAGQKRCSHNIKTITIHYVPAPPGDTANCFICSKQLVCVYFDIIKKGYFYRWDDDIEWLRYIYHPLIDSIPFWKRMIYRFYLPTSQFSVDLPDL